MYVSFIYTPAHVLVVQYNVTHTHTHIHTYTHAHIHTYAHTRTHTHTHANTHNTHTAVNKMLKCTCLSTSYLLTPPSHTHRLMGGRWRSEKNQEVFV